MPAVTMTVGLLLSITGLGAYFGTGMASATALIPTFFGVPILLLGMLARSGGRRKHAVHLALVLALLALLGSIGAIGPFFSLLAGGEVERPAAVVSRTLVAVICLTFLGLGVRSFLAARRAREG